MKHVITEVERGSVAYRHGLREGDAILTINGEAIIDEIDYQALIAQTRLTVVVEDHSGQVRTVAVEKQDWEPLGLHFGQSMTLSPRSCRNKCVFCFIDQLPPNMRDPLYVKDDDWRFSLMMGNFVTLTNVDDDEFERIIRRHASPLYISVHTTDPQLRCRMMNNRFAGDVLARLKRLKDEGIRYHCQIVCVPGWNDGDKLMQTLTDLRDLMPATQSVAIVPVGLTKFREGLEPLTLFTRESAKALLTQLAPFQAECRQRYGTTFAFPSDEFYALSGEPVPPAEWYEGFAQIENGVGMMAKMAQEMADAQEDEQFYGEKPAPARTYVLITGVSAAPFLAQLANRYAPPNVTVRIAKLINHFFGETITVTGLLTGADTLSQLTPDLLNGADSVLLSHNMLRHERDRFLDDMTLDEFTARLPVPVRIVEDGYDLYLALRGRAAGDE